MKFINGKLITVGFKANKELLFSYEGKLRPTIKITSDVELNDSDNFYLNLTYNIAVNTKGRRLLNKYIGEYNFQIENDGLPVKDDKEFILEHVKTGLIYALNKCSGNHINFLNAVWPLINLSPIIEKILSFLIRLDYYNY